MKISAPHDSAKTHVTGLSQFIEDYPPIRGELYIGIATSPVARGQLQDIDFSEAAKMDGVHSFYKASDFQHNCWGANVKDQPILASEQISYVGEPIALVAAVNQQVADRAAEKIKLMIEKQDAILTIKEARRQGSFFQEPVIYQCGNFKEVLEQAPHVLEGAFYCKGQDHFYLESQSVITFPDENDELLVHSSTQHPSEVQHVVAHSLGLSLNQVVCQVKRMGGAFGGKESQASHYAALCALVSHKTKKIARLHLSKDDDMIATGKRHPFLSEYRVGFDKEGSIQFLDVKLFSNGGAFLDLSAPVLQRAMLHIDNAYFLPHARIAGRVCRTNLPPNTAFRGFGGPQGVGVIENIMEEIATFLNVDPLLIRERNLYGTQGRNRTHYGQIVENNTLPQLFSQLAAQCQYYQRQEDIRVFNCKNRGCVRGLALTPVKFGISFTLKHLNQANALVNVHMDGTVQVSTGATEMGQGVNIKIAQIVADVFGIDVNQVRIMATSTEKNHNTSATAASSGSDLNGSAAREAASLIKRRLAKYASYYLSCTKQQKPDPISSGREFGDDSYESFPEVCFHQGQVFLKHKPKEKLSFPKLIKLAYTNRISLGAYGHYKTKNIHFDRSKGQGSPFLYFTNGVGASEVEINEYTGELKVLRVDILMDLGRPLNVGVDYGQIAGGFIQGMGWVTCEDLHISKDGKYLTHSPTTYKIPNIQDIPRCFNIDLIENKGNSKNIHGSKAVGEPPFLLALSIWAAAKKAVKFRNPQRTSTMTLPATSEEILRLLTDRDENYEPERLL